MSKYITIIILLVTSVLCMYASAYIDFHYKDPTTWWIVPTLSLTVIGGILFLAGAINTFLSLD